MAHGLSCPTACWILVPRPGIEPVSPALVGRLLTTGQPGKVPSKSFFMAWWFLSTEYYSTVWIEPFIHSPAERYLSCCHVLAIKINLVQTCICRFLCRHSFQLLWEIPRSITARSHGKSVFSFVRNCQTIFQSNCTILHSHQQWFCIFVSAFGGGVDFDFGQSDRCAVVRNMISRIPHGK